MKKILKAVSLVFIFTILSRLIGFSREIVIGNYVGANAFADEITYLYTIPLYIQMIVGGALTTSYVSISLKGNEQWAKKTYIHANKISSIFSIVIVLFLLVFYVDSINQYSKLLAGLISFSTIYFYNKSSLLSGRYNIEKNFLPPLVSVILGNILGIVLIIGINELNFEPNIILYAASFLFSSIIMYLYLIKRTKYYYVQKEFNWEYDILKKILIVAIPIVLGGAIPQILNLIQRVQLIYMQKELVEGSLATFNYASKIINFPQGIIITLVSSIFFPKIVLEAQKDILKFKKLYFNYEKKILGLTLVMSLLLVITSKIVVEILFGYGDFDKRSLKQIEYFLKVLSLSNVPLILTIFLTRFFYAIEKSYKSVVINFLNIIVLNSLTFSFLVIIKIDVINSVILSTYISIITNYLFMRRTFKKI